jgi:hypothetical protein
MKLNLGMTRGNQILVVILVLQLLITVVAFASNTPVSAPAGGALLPNFKPENVTSITIKDSDKNELVLAKNATGGWVLPNADNFPVADTQVNSFLSKVQALKANRLIAQNSTSYNQLHVGADSYERLVEFKETGDKVERLYIGTATSGSATHMRANDQDQVFLTSGLSSTDAATRAATWITAPYFTVNQDNIVILRVKNPQGAFEFNKVSGTWTLNGLAQGEILKTDSVTNLLSQVSNIYTSGPLGLKNQDQFQMKTPAVSVTLLTRETVQPTAQASATPTVAVQPLIASPTAASLPPEIKTVETTYTLDFGAKLADGNYVLKSSQSSYYVEVSASTAEALLNLKRADLLVPPPTPTATPTITPTPIPPTPAAATSEATAEATAPATSTLAAATASPTPMPTAGATAEATAASTPQ